jgi:hypothetical protein
MRDKKGISSIVATVLIILISVAGVAIVWVVLSDMITDKLSSINTNVDLQIVTAEGYTVWDNDSRILSVQVARGNDESEDLIGFDFVFTLDGESVTHYINETLDLNSKKTYYFNLTDYSGHLDSVKIVPIFKTGIAGSVASEVEFSSISEGDLTEEIEELEEDEDETNDVVAPSGTSGSSSGGSSSSDDDDSYCGDGTCDSDEDCSSCEDDCGECEESCVPIDDPCGNMTCGEVINGTCGNVSCGTCENGYYCNSSGMCEEESIEEANYCGGIFPDETNTGLTNPDILTYVEGFDVEDNNIIIENLEIDGQLTIEASNVIIRNCRIWPDETMYGILIDYDGFNITIENCEIGYEAGMARAPNKGIAIRSGSSNVSIIDNYIHHVGDGIFSAYTNLLVEGNYITECVGTDQNDSVDSYADHKGDGLEILGPATNVIIRNNHFDIYANQTSNVLIDTNWGNISGVLIEGNLFNGAGYSLRTTYRDDGAADELFEDLTIINNYFGRNYTYGIWSNEIENPVTYGNVWCDTLEPVPEPLGNVL